MIRLFAGAKINFGAVFCKLIRPSGVLKSSEVIQSAPSVIKCGQVSVADDRIPADHWMNES